MTQSFISCIFGCNKPFLAIDYYDMKKTFPESIIAIEHDGALYFTGSDAEKVHEHFRKPISTTHGVQYCVVTSDERESLFEALYENGLLMSHVRDRELVNKDWRL